MKYKMSNIWAINFLGYLFLACGIAGMIADILGRTLFSFALNTGIFPGNAAIAAAGLLATMVAKSLKELDRRLQRIEDTQHHLQR